MKKISIIIPFFNEAEVLAACHARVCAVLAELAPSQSDHNGYHSEIIYVDDGSNDGSWATVESLVCPDNVDLRCLQFSRNFGKEAAMSAGLQAVTGDAVILLDADLQDPPELIPAMLAAWQEGAEVVEMQRQTREGETWFKKTTARLFYKLINALSDIEITENVGDFRLLDRRVVDEINRLPERTRFMKGIFAWPGFRRQVLSFNRDARQAGTTKWNYFKLYHLALEGITSFSSKPLRIAMALGLSCAAMAFALALIYLVKTLFLGDPATGFPTLIIVMLLLGGIQLMAVGLLGEYIGRLFIEVKQRPLYIVAKEHHYSSQHPTSTESKSFDA